jgi:hypothetical protein
MQIFISYASNTRDLVTSLAEDLEGAGHDIWFDHKLRGGQDWWNQILESIRQCELFIFALSPQALDSYPCQLEFRYAHQLGKNILPVMIADGVQMELVAPELTVIQFVDYRVPDRQSAFRLMNAIMYLPPPKSLPDPLPDLPAAPISYLGSLNEQITAAQLSLEEQSTLVIALKQHLEEPENRPEIIELLKKFRSRQDLFASIDKEIDTLLADAEKSFTPNRAREVSPPQFRKLINVILANSLFAVAAAWGLVGLVFGGVFRIMSQFPVFSLDSALGICSFLSGSILGYITWLAISTRQSYVQIKRRWWIMGYGLAIILPVAYLYLPYYSEQFSEAMLAEESEEFLTYLSSRDYSGNTLLLLLLAIALANIVLFYFFDPHRPGRIAVQPEFFRPAIYLGLAPLLAAGVAHQIMGIIFSGPMLMVVYEQFYFSTETGIALIRAVMHAAVGVIFVQVMLWGSHRLEKAAPLKLADVTLN